MKKPLAQGLLTSKYLKGIPSDSRATVGGFLKASNITPDVIAKTSKLEAIAKSRNQSLAQMAFAWVLRLPAITSALMGASRVAQIDEAVSALTKLAFGEGELVQIEKVLRS